MTDAPLPTAPCVECGEPAVLIAGTYIAVHGPCFQRILNRLADLQTAVAVAREERDRAEQIAKARVQAEMAALRKVIARLKRPAED